MCIAKQPTQNVAKGHSVRMAAVMLENMKGAAQDGHFGDVADALKRIAEIASEAEDSPQQFDFCELLLDLGVGKTIVSLFKDFKVGLSGFDRAFSSVDHALVQTMETAAELARVGPEMRLHLARAGILEAGASGATLCKNQESRRAAAVAMQSITRSLLDDLSCIAYLSRPPPAKPPTPSLFGKAAFPAMVSAF